MRRIIATMRFNKNVDKRYPHVWFHVFVFPFMLLAPMMFLMRYLGMGMTEVSVITVGMIAWRFVYISQSGISFGLLVPLWTKTIRDYESSPIKDWEYMLGQWIYWSVVSVMTLVYMSAVAWFLVGFNLFSGGIMLIPCFIVFCIMAIPLGLITLSVVYSLGIKADLIAWSVTDVILFLSGVFYPVLVFPEWLQAVSYSLPSTWGLIALRSLFTGGFDWHAFGVFTALTLVFAALMWLVFSRAKKRAMKNGFMQKY